MATLLLAAGRKKEAMELLERAVGRARTVRARMLANLGVIQWQPGGKAEGAAAGRQHPDIERILEDHAQVLATTGHKAESRAASERALEMKSAFGWQANTGSARWTGAICVDVNGSDHPADEWL